MSAKEIILYILFGTFNTVIGFLFYVLFIYLGLIPFVANTIASCIVIVFSFITNKIFIFESKSRDKEVVSQEVSNFFGARFVSLFAESFLIQFLVIIGVNHILAKIITSIPIILANYLVSKFIVFKKKNKFTISSN